MSFNVKILQEYTNSYYTDEYLTYMLIYMLYDNDFDYYHPLYISVIVHEFNKYCLSDQFQYFPKSVICSLIPELDNTPFHQHLIFSNK